MRCFPYTAQHGRIFPANAHKTNTKRAYNGMCAFVTADFMYKHEERHVWRRMRRKFRQTHTNTLGYERDQPHRHISR